MSSSLPSSTSSTSLTASPTKRSRSILHGLIIPDNKIYNQLQEDAVKLASTKDITVDKRSLRMRLKETDYNLRKMFRSKSPTVEHDPSNSNQTEVDSSRSYERRQKRVSRLDENRSKIRSESLVKPQFLVSFKYNNNNNNIIKNINNNKITLKNHVKKPTILKIKNPNDTIEVDEDELELPYRGLFSFEQANTYYTQPTQESKIQFNKLLKESEDLKLHNGDLSLVKKLTTEEEQAQHDYEVQTLTISKMRCIHFRNYEIDTWYKSPYPQEYSSKYVLNLCEYCLKYFSSSFTLKRHELKCQYLKHPPGNEIYRDGKVAIFEIDGRKNVVYCQNLCLFAKLFLNSKTLYYDVEPFMFYVLCELDSENNYHFVGYFSKEKLNGTNYNLSCIMTLPIYQRKGYGNFLIDFSYLLSKREYRLGTPEKPLSDLGLLSYRNYWKISIAKALLKFVETYDMELNSISIDDLANFTGMIHNDVIVGLEQLNALVMRRNNNRKFEYGIIINIPHIKELISRWDQKGYVQLNPIKLIWKSVILGPSGGINTTSTMVITTEKHSQDDSTTDHNNKYDEKGNQLMSNISLIINFLRDDLEDDRDLEDQIMERVKSNTVEKREFIDVADEEDSKLLFEQGIICYPGVLQTLELNKSQRQKNGTPTHKSSKLNINDDDDEEELIRSNLARSKSQILSDEDEDEEDVGMGMGVVVKRSSVPSTPNGSPSKRLKTIQQDDSPSRLTRSQLLKTPIKVDLTEDYTSVEEEYDEKMTHSKLRSPIFQVVEDSKNNSPPALDYKSEVEVEEEEEEEEEDDDVQSSADSESSYHEEDEEDEY